MYKSVNWSVLTPPPPTVGDIVFYDGQIKYVTKDKWNDSLGIPVGVVVISGDMLPDGKARFIALQDASASTVTWGPTGGTSLTNYTKVPTTDNAGSTTTGSNDYGYLPSDDTVYFSGATSHVDPKTKYYDSYYFIPSPYLEDGSLNPAYCETISGYDNVLSDFNGKSNTDVLVGLGTRYEAANTAKSYSVDGVDIDWYLPAAGELGFLIPRYAAINESIAIVGSVDVPRDGFWSSSESSSRSAYFVATSNGFVYNHTKSRNFYVRPFAIL